MEEVFSTVINNTINSFDFTLCILINIATYLVIKTIQENKRIKVSTWHKRLIFLIISIVCSLVYYYTGSDIKVLFNTIILAPVSWSWILKPVCNKFNIDYSVNNKCK